VETTASTPKAAGFLETVPPHQTMWHHVPQKSLFAFWTQLTTGCVDESCSLSLCSIFFCEALSSDDMIVTVLMVMHDFHMRCKYPAGEKSFEIYNIRHIHFFVCLVGLLLFSLNYHIDLYD
jgi:hypothetical protein